MDNIETEVQKGQIKVDQAISQAHTTLDIAKSTINADAESMHNAGKRAVGSLAQTVQTEHTKLLALYNTEVAKGKHVEAVLANMAKYHGLYILIAAALAAVATFAAMGGF